MSDRAESIPGENPAALLQLARDCETIRIAIRCLFAMRKTDVIEHLDVVPLVYLALLRLGRNMNVTELLLNKVTALARCGLPVDQKAQERASAEQLHATWVSLHSELSRLIDAYGMK